MQCTCTCILGTKASNDRFCHFHKLNLSWSAVAQACIHLYSTTLIDQAPQNDANALTIMHENNHRDGPASHKIEYLIHCNDSVHVCVVAMVTKIKFLIIKNSPYTILL